MTDVPTNPASWSLGDDDRELLNRLTEAIRSLVDLTQSGRDLIGVGEALDAIECLLEGSDIEVNVGLDTGFRRGDKNFEEGLFICFRINCDEIVLDELHTSYTAEIGGDHFTVTYAHLDPQGKFDEDGVQRWLDQFSVILAEEDARLMVSRDHV